MNAMCHRASARCKTCHATRLFIFVFVLLCVRSAVGQSTAADNGEGSPRFRMLWAEAIALQDTGQYVAAADAFRSILVEFPKSQRAALHIGICEELAGYDGNAVDSYQAALDINPFGTWADKALYQQARTCKRHGCIDTAFASIQLLRRRFPESAWTVRAEIVRAELSGLDTANAQANFDAELVAGLELDAIRELNGSIANDEQLARLDNLTAAFPTSATALRARERRGHLLIRQERLDDAINEFEDLLLDMQGVSPDARLVQVAKTRLAALYHKVEDRGAALIMFDDLATTAADPAIHANAELQAAGVQFEILQRRQSAAQEVDSNAWHAVRARCRRIEALPAATEQETARAALMHLETYSWQRQPVTTKVEAEAFLARFSQELFPWETAQARLLLGEAALELGDAASAVQELQGVTQFVGNRDFWPGSGFKEHLHYRLFDALARSGADESLVKSAARVVLQDNANSEYATLVRNYAGFKSWPNDF